MFWAKSAQKRYLYPKTEQVNTTIEFSIYIRISLDTKFQLKLAILIFGTNFPKKGSASVTGRYYTYCTKLFRKEANRPNGICLFSF